MPAIATLEELKTVEGELNRLKEKYPEAYNEFADLLKKNRKIGYKNVCKIWIGDATPEKLKGME